MSYGYGGGLVSPVQHFRLTTIEGNADDIEAAGRQYTRVGNQMEWTAAELDSLSAESKFTAEGLDAIRESAGELAGDLHKVAKRYTGTGPVLVTYADALRTAQVRTVDPLVEPIQQAHDAHEAAQEELEAAQRTSNDLDRTWIWETEPTDAERRAAASQLTEAQQAANSAGGSLEELWVSFEAGYDNWESAYETAVTAIEDAYEASGISDTWWEDALDTIAQVATVVGTILVILAIVITGPISGILLAIAAVLSAIALIAHIIMMANGSKRVSMTDIVFDAIGVVPFLGAFGKSFASTRAILPSLRSAAGLGGATRTTIAAGRNAIAYDLRSIAGAGGSFGGRSARVARAGGIADEFLEGVGQSWGRNAWNAVRNGGTALDGQALTMSERMASAWPGGRTGSATTNWLRSVEGVGPITQGFNVWNLGYGAYQSAEAVGAPLPSMPDFVPNPFGGR
ncbi:MAG: hypothetical protein KKH75_03605 [Actinobacteria bacterium]|nr:hypothetical protein [Actinomycetota bacterium]